ncbi:MAG: acyl-CoA thioesterase domain-containing protein [Pseudomonadota bacterium]
MSFEPWDGRDIVATVRVVPVGVNRFLSTVGQRNINGQLFGGQALGLSLQAACETVDNRLPHMLSGQFVRPARVNAPVEIMVERVFDGGAFASRRVVLVQDGLGVFYAHASFQLDMPGTEHAPAAPAVPPPDSCPPLEQSLERLAATLSAGARRRTRPPPSIEVRPIDAEQYLRDPQATYRRRAWVRCPGAASAPVSTHHALLAYLSDYWLAETGATAHETRDGVDFGMASLNQAMWFYRPFRVDQWMLVDCDSPTAQHGRATGRADIFADGALVASAVQEVMMRPK